MWVKSIAIAAGAAACLACAGVAGADPATPTPAPTPGPKTSITSDGTYAVGTDVVPGTYTSAGPVADGTCYWRRTGNPDGATLDNALSKQPQTVQIAPDDKAFKTNGCQPWQLSDSAAPAPSLAPAVAGQQLQGYMNDLNARAAASGQAPPP